MICLQVIRLSNFAAGLVWLLIKFKEVEWKTDNEALIILLKCQRLHLILIRTLKPLETAFVYAFMSWHWYRNDPLWKYAVIV